MPTNDSETIDALRRGDPHALGALMRTYAEPLIAYAASLTQSDDGAQDVVQDVFLRIWERRETLPNDLSIVQYLFRATRNAAFDLLRSERRTGFRNEAAAAIGIGVPPALPHSSVDIEVNELSRIAARVVTSLPPACQEIFLLTRRGGLTYAETAAVLGISVSTVKTQMARALAALARALTPVIILEATRAVLNRVA